MSYGQVKAKIIEKSVAKIELPKSKQIKIEKRQSIIVLLDMPIIIVHINFLHKN